MVKKLALPSKLCEKIANQALQQCRLYAIQRGWKSADKLYAVWGKGKAGVKTSAHYLIYQDKGTRPFVMTSLEGKVVPLKDNTGAVRYILAKNVGTPGFVSIPGDPNIPPSPLYKSNAARPGIVWREQRWRHPGINPTYFITNTVQQSINNSKPTIKGFLKKIFRVDAI